jgi:hypothetical protein
VGIWPAFSWASRAALSVFSWAAFSLEWNVPDGATEVLPFVAVVLVVAALLAVGAKTVAPSKPPVAIEPRTVETRIAFRFVFIAVTSLVVPSRLEGCAQRPLRK